MSSLSFGPFSDVAINARSPRTRVVVKPGRSLRNELHVVPRSSVVLVWNAVTNLSYAAKAGPSIEAPRRALLQHSAAQSLQTDARGLSSKSCLLQSLYNLLG